MTRYKGRQSAEAVEKDFPHFVDMVVPLGGLGNRLDAMYEFHTLYRKRSAVVAGAMKTAATIFVGALLIPRWLNHLRLRLARQSSNRCLTKRRRRHS